MKYMYDTEFLEDGKTIDLISIGIVAEDGREFYAVSNEFDTARVAQDKWLMANVMRSIEHVPFEDEHNVPNLIVIDDAAMSRDNIRKGLIEFFGNDTKVELWAWYGAYDHVALAQLFGRMIDLPPNIPMFTHDIRQLADNARFGIPGQPAGLHNALEDARWNWARYNYLTGLQ